MKKNTRKRLAAVGYCFLTAAFLAGFLWAQGAHILSNQARIFLNGYVTCVKQGQTQLTLPERTMLLLPNGAIEATSLEYLTFGYRDQFAQGLHVHAD